MGQGRARAEGDVVQGTYRVVRVLGSGGFATTYEVVDVRSGARAALKEAALRDAKEWKAVELFEREARVLRRIEHRAIPRYVEDFTIEGAGDVRMVLVQELADGPSLARKVADGWRADEAQAMALAREALGALAYLHGLLPPIVHRDIKPENVIVRDGDGDGRLALVDFGAVRDAWTGAHAGRATVVGTFGYMAPEQYRGQPGPQSDLYALGLTVVFALTGKAPTELPQRRLELEYRPFARISPGFARWIDRMIAPALEDRFESAKDARIALDGVGQRRSPARAALAVAVPAVVASTAALAMWAGSNVTPATEAQAEAGAAEVPLAANVPGIRVNGTQPGVKLFLDGREVGPLPQEMRGLAPGDHVVRFAASERYLPIEKHLTVGTRIEDLGTVTLKVLKGKATIILGTPGARVFLASGVDRRELPVLPISVDIDTSREWRILASEAGYRDYMQPISFDDGVAEKSYTVWLAEHARSYVPPAEGAEGYLNINSIPPSMVFLDGQSLGRTPKVHVAVRPGPHLVKFVDSEDRVVKIVPVTVGAGETRPAVAKLDVPARSAWACRIRDLGMRRQASRTGGHRLDVAPGPCGGYRGRRAVKADTKWRIREGADRREGSGRRQGLIGLCVALAACSHPSGRTSAGATTTASESGGAGPEPPTAPATGEPARIAVAAEAGRPECLRDSDCTVAPWPIDDAPCCDAPYTMVQSKSVVEARAAFRRSSPACRDLDCTQARSRFGGPPPTPPAKCYFEPRCRNSRCGDSC